MVWGGKVPFFRDLSQLYYPMRFSLAESYKAGELPLWDRHVAMGFPLLANFQSGAFYLPHLLLLFLPFFDAIRALFVFHFLVAATGTFCLCRRWNYSPSLALIGAFLFTFGGYTVSLTNLLSFFQTAVWLPWVLLAWERCLRSQCWKDFLLLTFVLLHQFLAGAPEIYAMGQGLLLLDGLRFRAVETNISFRRLLFILLAANGLVALLAMIQISPTIELFLQSRAHHTISYSHSVYWSLRPISLVNLFVLDREVVSRIADGLRLFFAKDIPLIISLYMGAIALPGIFLWLLQSSFKEKSILIGMFIIALVLAIGDYTPIYSLLSQYIPFFGLIRYPEKFSFLIYALLLFIILKGFSYFLCPDLSFSRKPLVVFTSIWFAWSILYLILRFDTASLSQFIAQATGAPLLSASTLDRMSSALLHLERQIALTACFLLLFFFRKKGAIRTPLFNILFVAIVFIDLNSAHGRYQFLLKPDFVYAKNTVLSAPDPEPHRLFYYPGSSDLHPSYYSLSSHPSFAEFRSMLFSNLLPNTGVIRGFDYMQDLDSMAKGSYVTFVRYAGNIPPKKQYRLLAALNVKYVNSFRPLPKGDITLLRHFPEYPSWLYKLDRAVPRVYIVSDRTEEKDPLKVLDQLSSAEFDPLRKVILENAGTIPQNNNFQSQAKILRYENQHITIRASLNSPGILVLADSFYPGWRVYVNGNESKIVRANFLFRGVPLTAGQHLVEFRYQPRSFTIGLSISLITLCGIFLWSVALSLLKRRTTAESIKAGNSV